MELSCSKKDGVEKFFSRSEIVNY